MKDSDLQAIGNYLFGERWKSPLSRALNISEDTLRSIATGRRNMNPGLANDIYELAAKRQFEELLPLLQNMLEKHGLPEDIELSVSGNDNKVTSIHKRAWSNAADFAIKTHLAAMLTKAGITAFVRNNAK